IRSTTTAADGTYRFGMDPGTYDVKAGYGYLYSPGLVEGVVVTAGGAATANVTMNDGGVFYGYLFKSDGTRLASATVEISQGTDVKRTATTNSSGYWRINNVAVGTYDVKASATGYVSQTKSGTINANAYSRLDFTLVVVTAGVMGNEVYQLDGVTLLALQEGPVIRNRAAALFAETENA
ncbi:MAG TPA: hypothetical protein DCO77_09165, partial [Nitrospiraceae bacterium]|nr:hypothetical protein [Nitrospiraceae bacterium]